MKSSKTNINSYVIGVDGGGTKTAVALADLNGKILARSVSAGSNLRDSGIKVAARNVARGISEVSKGRKGARVVSTFIGLPAVEEEYKDKKGKVMSELKKDKKIARIFSGKVIIGSDQLVAFRSGSLAKNGIVAISGTGCAVHGWNNGKEFLTNNWGWLVSKGSGNWIGLKTAQAIVDHFEEGTERSLLSGIVFKKMGLGGINDLLTFIYKDPAGNLPKLSEYCNEAADKGDLIARAILEKAGREIAISVCAVASKLDLLEKVPLVLVGGAYRSRWMLNAVKKDVELCHSGKFEFILPKDPVEGAIRLALENAENNS
ncbi:MAG: BadF/BadG/BcrA/BcrD ATPase family protein [Candidatus Paceibacterota bacterium]|jgi:N-acetylglucosamine kinase-like BadF-type ATPase